MTLRTIDSGRLIDGEKISNLPNDTTAELGLKENISNKGQPNGYASLDGTGKVPSSQLPAGTGTGDMLKAIYDPNNKEKEVAFKDEIASGVGGYTANIYFTTLVSSTNPAYKQISYTPEVAETIISDSVTAGEKLLTTYIYDLDYGSSIIDAGEWVFNLYGNCSPTAGLSTFRFEVFTRDNLGVETNLFDVSSGDISGTNERITIYSTQPTYNVNTTDRVGVRVYINTTHNSLVTFNFKVGNGEASYFFAPIAIRHNLLRARDVADAHPISSITGLQTELDGKANLSGATFTGGITATNLSGTNTGDETAASIKTKYESNSNTNAFTDSEKSKLAGIESGAEVNEVTLSGNESLTNKVINGVGITSSGDGSKVLANNGSYIDIPSGATGDIPAVIKPYAGATAPDGYFICDGQAVSRTTYSVLFGIIGTTYGIGDGSTTFNIPNLKGKTIVGFNTAETEFNAVGKTGGAKTHTLTIDEMPAHTHGYNDWSGSFTGGNEGKQYLGQTTQTTSTGGSLPHNNLQPYIALNYIIKF